MCSLFGVLFLAVEAGTAREADLGTDELASLEIIRKATSQVLERGYLSSGSKTSSSEPAGSLSKSASSL